MDVNASTAVYSTCTFWNQIVAKKLLPDATCFEFMACDVDTGTHITAHSQTKHARTHDLFLQKCLELVNQQRRVVSPVTTPHHRLGIEANIIRASSIFQIHAITMRFGQFAVFPIAPVSPHTLRAVRVSVEATAIERR